LHFSPALNRSETEFGHTGETIMAKLVLVAACALINAEGRVLIAQRPPDKQMGGLWEFPGGKLEPGESPETALVRELQEELGITVQEQDLTPFHFASHPYGGFHLLMPLYICRRWEGVPVPKEHTALDWVLAKELSGFAMPPADLPLIPMLCNLL
jgi:mutator mutT protein